MDEEILHIIKIQLMYICRPYCKVRDKFIEKIGENLKNAGINQDGELWIEIMARVIKSCSPINHQQREGLIYPCLDAIEFLIKGDGDKRN